MHHWREKARQVNLLKGRRIIKENIMENGEKGWVGDNLLMGLISWLRNHTEPSRHKGLPCTVCLLQPCTPVQCGTLQMNFPKVQHCSLPNHAQPVLLSIHILHRPDHPELTPLSRISISPLSLKGDPGSYPGCQSPALYKHLLPLSFTVLCIFQWNFSRNPK